MKVTVQASNFTAKDSLLLFVEKKLSKLEHFYHPILFADIYLKVQKTREKENKKVEILVSVPGGDFIVKKEAKSFEQGTDACVQSLERQLKKKKQKQRAFL